MIDDEELRAFATQQVEIAAIEYLPGRYRRDRFDHRSYNHVEWGAARPVHSTHDLGTTLPYQGTSWTAGGSRMSATASSYSPAADLPEFP